MQRSFSGRILSGVSCPPPGIFLDKVEPSVSYIYALADGFFILVPLGSPGIDKLYQSFKSKIISSKLLNQIYWIMIIFEMPIIKKINPYLPHSVGGQDLTSAFCSNGCRLSYKNLTQRKSGTFGKSQVTNTKNHTNYHMN